VTCRDSTGLEEAVEQHSGHRGHSSVQKTTLRPSQHLPRRSCAQARKWNPHSARGEGGAGKHREGRQRRGYTIPQLVIESRCLQSVISSILQQQLLAIDISTLVTDILRLGEGLSGPLGNIHSLLREPSANGGLSKLLSKHLKPLTEENSPVAPLLSALSRAGGTEILKRLDRSNKGPYAEAAPTFSSLRV
jgi:hypothetical protein